MRSVFAAALLILLNAAGLAQSPKDSAHVKAQAARLDSVNKVWNDLLRWCNVASYRTPNYLRIHCPAVKLRPDMRARRAEDSLLIGPVVPPPPTPPANQKPKAAFTVSWLGDTVTLDASSSSDDLGITEHNWFTSLPERTPRSGVVTHKRVWRSSSVPWTEWLVVRDSAGLVDTTFRQILGPPTPQPPPVVTPPPVDTQPPTQPPSSSGVMPELPRREPVVPVSLSTLPCTATVGPGQLQAALNAARGGSVICLTGTHTGTFTVPARTDAGWVVLRSAGVIPAGRMRPSLAGSLAKIVTPGSAGNSALIFAPRSVRTLVLGLELTTVSSMAVGPSAIVEVGSGNESTVSDLPTDIAFDRVYIHGWPTQSIRRAFAFNGAALTVTASWCSEIHASGFDSQCVASWNGFGPMLIADNYLEAASENISFGGSQNNLVGVLPSDITIRRNHIAKPLGWKGAGWNVKNLIESKFSRRVLVEDNFLEGTWADAQSGNILLLKAGNPGGCNWCTTTDWTMRWNYIRNVSDGFAFGGRAEMGTGSSGAFVHQDSTVRRVLIEDNWIGPMGVAPYTGRGRLVSFDVDNRWITIRRNVFEGATGSQASAVLFGDTTARDIEITGNVFARGLYGLFTGGASEGLASWNAGPRNPKQWSGNCVIGSTAAAYPPGTTWGTLTSCLTVTGLSRTVLDARVAGVVVPP